MKTKELREAVQKVLAAVDSKSVISQTDHLIFSDGIVSAYNGRISISTPIDIDLEFSVPATDFYKILKTVEEEDVELSLEEGVLHIVSDSVRAAVSTEIEEESALSAIRNFDLDNLYNGKCSEVPSNFIEAVELSMYSASKNADDMDNLNCICVDGSIVTSGDGYRATEVKLKSSMDRVLIPLSSAIELTKFSPQDYVISDGWMHLIDDVDSVFSFRFVQGDFPDVAAVIKGFVSESEVLLPEELIQVAESLGAIAESPIENFKTVEINLSDDSIEVVVDKSGVSVTKVIEFKGTVNKSFIISAPMLISILKITRNMNLNSNFAVFSDENFTHIISLIQ